MFTEDIRIGIIFNADLESITKMNLVSQMLLFFKNDVKHSKRLYTICVIIFSLAII